MYKFAVIGPAGCGKSTWINRVVYGDFFSSNLDSATLVGTTRGTRRVQFREFRSLGEIPPGEDLDGFILVTSIDAGAHDVRPASLASPCVDCYFKADMVEDLDEFAWRGEDPAFIVSAKSMYNFEKPILCLIRAIEGDDGISLLA